MELRVEISPEQMQTFEKGIDELFRSLTEQQKIQVVSDVISKNRDELLVKEVKKDRYYDGHITSFELTELGEIVVKDIKKIIADKLFDFVLNDRECKKIIDENIKTIENNLQTILRDTLIKYIVDTFFNNRDKIENIAIDTFYNNHYRAHNNK